MKARRRRSRENGDRFSVAEAAKAVVHLRVVKYVVLPSILRNRCRRYSKVIVTASFN